MEVITPLIPAVPYDIFRLIITIFFVSLLPIIINLLIHIQFPSQEWKRSKVLPSISIVALIVSVCALLYSAGMIFGCTHIASISLIETYPNYFESALPSKLVFDRSRLYPLFSYINHMDERELQHCLNEVQDFISHADVNTLIAFRICNNKRLIKNINIKFKS